MTADIYRTRASAAVRDYCLSSWTGVFRAPANPGRRPGCPRRRAATWPRA